MVSTFVVEGLGLMWSGAQGIVLCTLRVCTLAFGYPSRSWNMALLG